MGYAAEDRIFKVENGGKTSIGNRMEITAGFTARTAGPDPKVSIKCQTYDTSAEAGSKITQNIDIFLGLWEADVLAKDILSGRINKKGVKEKKRAAAEGDKFCKAVWQSHLAGTSAEQLKNRGKARPDGKSESRVMELLPASKASANGTLNWVLRAKKGAGKEMGNGLIAPDYSKPDEQVTVLLTSSQMKELACCLETLSISYMVNRWSVWDNREPITHNDGDLEPIEVDEDGVIY